MTHLSNICHTFAPDIIIIMIEKMMRKILFLATMLVASFGISSVANAKINDKQVDYENRNEIAISYGVYSNSQVISFYEDIIAIMVTGSRGYFDHEKFIGPIGAEYFYHVNKWLGIGGIGIYATQGKDIMSDLSTPPTNEGTSRLNYFTLLPAIKADWLRRPHFGMYSKLGLGGTFFNDKHTYNDGTKISDSDFVFSWQASLLGIEAGSNNLRGFLELSLIGEQGSILVGFRHKF